MNQLQIPILTYIEVTVKELDITTTALIDTGFEVTFFQNFLLPNWENSPLIEKSELKMSIHPHLFRTHPKQCVYHSRQ